MISNLINVNEQRMLKIFKTLYFKEQFWTLKDLSEELNISKTTVSLAIDNLNNFFTSNGNEFIIISKKSKGIVLKKINNTSSYSVYENKIVRNSLNFKIIDMLFQKKIRSVHAFSSELFLSLSTLYRSFTVINNFLKIHGLSLNKEQLCIQGDYHTLCEFYYHFYSTSLLENQWPFKIANKNEIELAIRDNLDKYEYKLSNPFITKVSYWLAIMLTQRMHSNNIISKKNYSWIDPIRKKTYAQTIEKLLNESKYKLNSIENQHLISMLCTTSFFNDVLINHEEVVKFYMKENNYKIVIYTMNRINLHFPEIDLLSNTHVIYQALNAINYMCLFPTLKTIGNDFLSKKDYSYLISILDSIFSDITLLFGIDVSFKSSFISNSLKILLASFPNQQWDKVIFIQVNSFKGTITELGYISVLSNRLKKNITFITSLQASYLSKEEISKIDLIISDISCIIVPNNVQVEYYYCSNPPSERDFLNIEKLLRKF